MGVLEAEAEPEAEDDAQAKAESESKAEVEAEAEVECSNSRSQSRSRRQGGRDCTLEEWKERQQARLTTMGTSTDRGTGNNIMVSVTKCLLHCPPRSCFGLNSHSQNSAHTRDKPKIQSMLATES